MLITEVDNNQFKSRKSMTFNTHDIGVKTKQKFVVGK